MLLDTIKSDSLQARRDRSAESGVLTTLLGEFATVQKAQGRANPLDPLSEDEMIALVRKFLKNNRDAQNELGRLTVERREIEEAKLKAEQTCLERYLPSQLSETDIETFVSERIASGIVGMGPLMAALKAERAGAYDGKTASSVVKRLTT